MGNSLACHRSLAGSAPEDSCSEDEHSLSAYMCTERSSGYGLVRNSTFGEAHIDFSESDLPSGWLPTSSGQNTPKTLRRYGTDIHSVGTSLEKQSFSIDKGEWLHSYHHPFIEPDKGLNQQEWIEDGDFEYLEDMVLVPSEDELEWSKYEISLVDYKREFFKIFSHHMRRNTLVINSSLPRLRKRHRLSKIFLGDETWLREVSGQLQHCHRATGRCFNFQRDSFIICTEGNLGATTEWLEIDGLKFEFRVNRYSAINPLCLWDFANFWGSNKKSDEVTDTSPWLTMTAAQWKEVLESDTVARSIMLYEPECIKFLQRQGEFSRNRTEKLTNIHLFSSLTRLILAEYIFLNSSTIKNGMRLRGRDIISFLEKFEQKRELFLKVPTFVIKFQLLDFVFNPSISSEFNWLELIPDGEHHSRRSTIRDRFDKRTIFLCDQIHWTLFFVILLEEQIRAIIEFIVGMQKMIVRMEDTENIGEMKGMMAQAKTEVKVIKKIKTHLPSLNKLEEYAKNYQQTLFLSGLDTECTQKYGPTVTIQKDSKYEMQLEDTRHSEPVLQFIPQQIKFSYNASAEPGTFSNQDSDSIVVRKTFTGESILLASVEENITIVDSS